MLLTSDTNPSIVEITDDWSKKEIIYMEMYLDGLLIANIDVRTIPTGISISDLNIHAKRNTTTKIRM